MTVKIKIINTSNNYVITIVAIEKMDPSSSKAL